MFKLICIGQFILFYSLQVFAFTQQELTLQLKKWHKNPTMVQQELPLKVQGRLVDPILLAARKEANLTRKAICKRGHLSSDKTNYLKSTPLPNDLASEFLGSENYLNNILKIDQLQLTHAEVENHPWSDSYWPIYKGMLGARYADNDFNEIMDWRQSYEYIKKHPATQLFYSSDKKQRDQLSPAEKYDFLISDGDMSLTHNNWGVGEHYDYRYGKVEFWMGICHGWAAASIIEPRPKHAINVQSAIKDEWITFYPADIKALASLLWAKADYESRFIAGRCKEKNPEEDENGRLINEQCLDTNPATWHAVMVNQIGKEKTSFVFDATYDYEVWNQPIISYQYQYFNPQESVNPTSNIQEAIVDITDFSQDRFKQYRSPQTKYIVGILMEAQYAVEIMPMHQLTDDEASDAHNKVLYMYDLELDENYNIIGGEWYQNAHPDFLWGPYPDSMAMTQSDFILEDQPERWNITRALPESWINHAFFTSSRQGSPLAHILQEMIRASQ